MRRDFDLFPGKTDRGASAVRIHFYFFFLQFLPTQKIQSQTDFTRKPGIGYYYYYYYYLFFFIFLLTCRCCVRLLRHEQSAVFVLRKITFFFSYFPRVHIIIFFFFNESPAAEFCGRVELFTRDKTLLTERYNRKTRFYNFPYEKMSARRICWHITRHATCVFRNQTTVKYSAKITIVIPYSRLVFNIICNFIAWNVT